MINSIHAGSLPEVLSTRNPFARCVACVLLVLCLWLALATVPANAGTFEPSLTLSGADYTLTINGSGRVVNLVVPPEVSDSLAAGTHAGFTQAQGLAKRIYEQISDGFDFIIFTSDQELPASADYYGVSRAVRNDIKGLGLGLYDDSSSYSSSGRLQVVVHLALSGGLTGGPSLHEILHRWGNHLKSIPSSVPQHWGFSSVGGQLGGWGPGTLQSLGDGRYSASNGQPGSTSFGTFANGGNGLPYAKLELYLMGLIPINEVPDIQIAMDASFNDDGTFSASVFNTVTASQIVATDGARVPDHTTSQKSFRALFVVVTKAPLADARFDYYDTAVENFCQTSSVRAQTGLYNFWEATGGRATMDMVISIEDIRSPMAPLITTQPASQSIQAGWNPSFAVSAIGPPTPTYEWQVSTNSGSSWSDLVNSNQYSGVTTGMLTITGATIALNGYQFRCVATNSVGSSNSTAAVLTVNATYPGTVVAWGAGTTATGLVTGVAPEFGQSIVPVGLSGVTAIAAGGDHTVALKSDGTVVAWGNNNSGQTTVPPGLSGVMAIAAGGQGHTVALKSDGTAVAWGDNARGQTTVPGGLSGVTAVAAGDFHTVALKSDGAVVAWGDNSSNQSAVPAGLSGVTAVAAGYNHTVALKMDGTVVAWGGNAQGQTTVPTGMSGVTAIAAGYWHTVALKSDGTVVAWGNNNSGQTTVPPGLSGVMAIAAGYNHTVALKSNGTVVAWGAGTAAADGYPNYGQSIVPSGMSGVTAIASGYLHTVALLGTGVVGAIVTPRVTVLSTGNTLTLLWPDSAKGYRVESTLSLSSPITWSNAPGSFQTNGGSVSIVLPITGGQKFYRLVKP